MVTVIEHVMYLHVYSTMEIVTTQLPAIEGEVDIAIQGVRAPLIVICILIII